jgi:hypothetical protein
MSFFTTYEYENIYQEFDHLLSIIIEGIRERERGKSESRKEEGNASNFSPYIKRKKQKKTSDRERKKKNK